METLNTSQTISNAPLTEKGMDFQWLRDEGIKHLQRLSGSIWTDYNLHDPGVTILDQLCYALTDLSYRIDYDIDDLLTGKDGNTFESLYSPAQILTTNPVTLLDIRKIIIDVPDVKNAWVELATETDPVIYLNPTEKSLRLTNPDETNVVLPLKGLYKVFIEKKNVGGDVQPAVRKRLMACRNVGEDFAEITVLDSQMIYLNGSIELGEVEDVNAFAANLFLRISRFISPVISFYTLDEMLQKGLQIDEIVDGPLLQHGFIDNDELLKYDRKTELHTSDIIRELMDVEGVSAVNNIELITSASSEKWRLILDKQKTPKLDVTKCLGLLKFVKNGLTIAIDDVSVTNLYETLLSANEQSILDRSERDIVLANGDYRNPGNYHSIQHHFPKAYGIGELGLPESASLEQQAKTRQLKAYLLFFDQLIANYHQQLEQVKELFSFQSQNATTYFNQSLSGIVPNAGDLLAENYEAWIEDNSSQLETDQIRKNKFLNHLLARFNESFTDYSLFLFDYSNKSSNKNMAPLEQSMRDKMQFLRNYPAISSDRFKAVDYTESFDDPTNRSGLEKRIAAKLGIPAADGSLLSEQENKEGFYLLEHILLRPITEDYMAYADFLVSRNITAFEKVDDTYVKCTSKAHGLQSKEIVTINGTGTLIDPGYDGDYEVDQVLPDSFVIKSTFFPKLSTESAIQELVPTWIRTKVDTTFLLLTRPVEEFAAVDGDPTLTRCKVTGHGLADQELIEINGTAGYNGKFIVTIDESQQDYFTIEKPFTADEPKKGRWISASQKKDPYSLQLTYVFPNWQDRFKSEVENDNNFREFIERVIREETPVHLTVYVRWLNKEEMAVFETTYYQFLEQLRNT
ncbi:MAG: hypothetical protein QE487_11560 [Fluviicola sp.]|nr:hypothetical protein [Fluviicola sp.]